ncbi:MAG: PKD domain-containing protein [Blastocatellales bacterium]
MNCTANVPANGQSGAAVSFSATANASGCSSQPTYAWNFGDGSQSSQQNPSHTYSTAGTYTWTLTTSVSSGSQTIDTIAGGLGEGNPVSQAPFGVLAAVARDTQGRGVYVADTIANMALVRFINTSASTVTLGGRQIAPGTVRVVAGGGLDLGENVPGLQADLGEVTGLAVSSNGDLVYLANKVDGQVRAINVSANSVTVAGQTVASGRVGTLVSAQGAPFNGIATFNGLAVHPSTGDVYAIDVTAGVNKVFKISSGGTATAVAGNGAITTIDAPFSAGAATGIPLLQPRAIEFDAGGNLFIADTGHGRVIRVDGGGSASLVHQFQVFNSGGLNVNPYPSGVAVVGGSVYVANGNSQTVERVATSGATVIAGQSGASCDYSISNCGDDGQAANAGFNMLGSTSNPPLASIEGDPNGLFIMDQGGTGRGRVRYVNLTGGSVTLAGVTVAQGVIRTIGGNGLASPYDGGLATGATFNTPVGVAVNSAGNLWISDTISGRLRFVNRSASQVTIFAGTPAAQTVPAGEIVTVNNSVGSGGGGTDGVPVNEAAFESPQGLFVTNQGIYVVDSRSGPQVPLDFSGRRTSLVRFINTGASPVTIFPGAGGNAITIAPGHIQKIAGGADQSQGGNGNGDFATLAKFFGASDIVVTANGTIYVTEVGQKAVRKVDGNTGVVSSLSLPTKEYTGLGFDSTGRLMIANYTDNIILRESSAGSGSFSNFATALNKPRDVAGASDGSAYVTNSGNHRIVRIDSSGTKSDIAGSTQGFGGDGGPATGGLINITPSALVIGNGAANQLPQTVNIVVGQGGEIIFTDSNNNRIRRIAASVTTCVKTGTITIAGNNPAPSLASISPNTALINSGAFTLTANGSNFTPSSVVRWNGQARTTNYVSGTQLTADIPSSDLTSAGTAQVTVFTPTPGGGTSSAQTFTVTQPNPVPSISSLSPNTATEGGSGFTLTVNGSGFVNGSVVRWDGQDRVTTFQNSTQLKAQILASDIIGIGQASVTVFNPTPGGGVSNVLTFNITAGTSPVPVLSSISPSSTPAGSASFILTANGSNFVATSKVRWNGQDLQTAFTSANQLTAQVPDNLVASGGTAQVTVFTPSPGGGTSAARTFTITAPQNPVPTLATLNPPAVPAGSGFTLAVTGTNFVSGSKVRINGVERVTTVVNSTQLTAAILASDVATSGDKPITVVNPAPGGGTSNALSLKVMPKVTGVSAASFLGAQLAPESIVAAFGSGMATDVAIANSLPLPTTLLGTTVKVTDSAGTTRDSSLFFVAPTQINFEIPKGTANGVAVVNVAINGNIVGAGTMNIAKVAPGLISANANGQGVAAAVVLRIDTANGNKQTFEQVARFDSGQSKFVPVPIDMGPSTDLVYVLLYGTGIRGRTSTQNIVVNIDGSSRPLSAAQFEDGFAAPGFVGLDQVNVLLPRSLIGRGQIDITLTVDGVVSNTVQLSIK